MTGYDVYFIHKAGTIDALNNLEDGLATLNAGAPGYLWLDYYRPTQDNLNEVADIFQIHFLSIEDCLDDEQIPKVNEYENYIQILFNKFSYPDKNILIEEINLFVGKNFLITVEKNNKTADGSFKAHRELLRDEIRKAKLGPVYALHIILDYIVDCKFSVIEALGDELARLEDVMTLNHKDFDQASLQGIRQALMSIRKSLFHEREIFVKIVRNDIELIPEKSIIHFNDIYDHITKFFELTEIYREMVTNIIQTNLAMINNDIATAANDTNLSVKRLTVITTIFMPLTLLTGIFGMSEWSMITGVGNWRLSYPVFFGLLAAIGIADYFFIKWLDKKDKK